MSTDAGYSSGSAPMTDEPCLWCSSAGCETCDYTGFASSSSSSSAVVTGAGGYHSPAAAADGDDFGAYQASDGFCNSSIGGNGNGDGSGSVAAAADDPCMWCNGAGCEACQPAVSAPAPVAGSSLRSPARSIHGSPALAPARPPGSPALVGIEADFAAAAAASAAGVVAKPSALAVAAACTCGASAAALEAAVARRERRFGGYNWHPERPYRAADDSDSDDDCNNIISDDDDSGALDMEDGCASHSLARSNGKRRRRSRGVATASSSPNGSGSSSSSASASASASAFAFDNTAYYDDEDEEANQNAFLVNSAECFRDDDSVAEEDRDTTSQSTTNDGVSQWPYDGLRLNDIAHDKRCASYAYLHPSSSSSHDSTSDVDDDDDDAASVSVGRVARAAASRTAASSAAASASEAKSNSLSTSTNGCGGGSGSNNNTMTFAAPAPLTLGVSLNLFDAQGKNAAAAAAKSAPVAPAAATVSISALAAAFAPPPPFHNVTTHGLVAPGSRPRSRDPASVAALTRRAAESLSTVLCTTVDDADVLLRRYDWDAPRLMRDWVERDPDTVRATTNTADPRDREKKEVVWSRDTDAAGKEKELVICCVPYCDAVPKKATEQLACGHAMCTEHWQSFIDSEMRNQGPGAVLTTCPGYTCEAKDCMHRGKLCKCKQLVPQYVFRKYLKRAQKAADAERRRRAVKAMEKRTQQQSDASNNDDNKSPSRASENTSAADKNKNRASAAAGDAVVDDSDLLFSDAVARYDKYISRSVAKSSPAHTLCSNPECECLIERHAESSLAIHKCDCGTLSCLQCGYAGGHVPCPCDLAKIFLTQTDSDAASLRLIEATTKRCPKCETAISKDKYCNHMQCTQCKFHFCWLCKADWNTHQGSYFDCSSYNQGTLDSKAVNERNEKEAQTRRMQKLYFFFSRFEANKSTAASVSQMYKKARAAGLVQGTDSLNGVANTSHSSSLHSVAMSDGTDSPYNHRSDSPAPTGPGASGLDMEDGSRTPRGTATHSAAAQARDNALLATAFENIIEARTFLQWSFAFAYFLKPTGFKELFEAHQAKLSLEAETTTEILSQCNGKYSDITDSPSLRERLMRSSQSLRKFTRAVSSSIVDNDVTALVDYETGDGGMKSWSCTLCRHVHIVAARTDLFGGAAVSAATETSLAQAKAAGADANEIAVLRMIAADAEQQQSGQSSQSSQQQGKAKAAGAKAAAGSAKDKLNGSDMAQWSKKVEFCSKCDACRVHSEQDCRVCKKR